MSGRQERIYMTDGRHLRKIHYGDGSTCGYAWIRAPWKKVRNYAASSLIARADLAERMMKRGWWYA